MKFILELNQWLEMWSMADAYRNGASFVSSVSSHWFMKQSFVCSLQKMNVGLSESFDCLYVSIVQLSLIGQLLAIFGLLMASGNMTIIKLEWCQFRWETHSISMPNIIHWKLKKTFIIFLSINKNFFQFLCNPLFVSDLFSCRMFGRAIVKYVTVN